jgi:hypothetical protein
MRGQKGERFVMNLESVLDRDSAVALVCVIEYVSLCIALAIVAICLHDGYFQCHRQNA